MLVTDARVRAAYAEGAGIYRILPAAVAIPENQDDVVALVRQARESNVALIPRGAGSGMPGGNVGNGVIVDLSTGFSDLVVDPHSRRARAGASVTWAEVNDAAKPYGLRLPPDPSSGAFATSGGMVATNAAGPRTVRYGSVRPWIEALEIVGADGAVRTVRRGMGNGERFALSADDRRLIIDHFPKTRKNSSGYALDRFAESGDEIELLDESLLQFVPEAPKVACLLLVEFERETAAAARGVVGDAVRGLKQAVTHVETAINRAGLERLWSVRREASPALARLPLTQRSLQLIEDGCVPLDALGAYVAGLRAAADRRDIPVAIFGHAGDGHVHVNALPDTTRDGWRESLRGLFDEVTELLLRLRGVPSGEHGVGRLRAGILERFYGPEVLQLFRDVKRAYDPLSILNQGVIIPATDWSPVAALKVGAGAADIPEDIATRLREVERSAAWATPKLELAH